MPLGSLISAGGSILGGLFGSRSSKKQAAASRAHDIRMAQNSIQWRVADAKAAGIHPLYALGASTASASPVTVVDPMGDAISNAASSIGQGITRRSERKAAEASLALDNEIKRATVLELQSRTERNKADAVATLKRASDLSRARTSITGAGLPRTSIDIADHPVKVDKGWSDAEDFETRYGDPLSWIYGLGVGVADLVNEYTDWQKKRVPYKPKKHRKAHHYR